MKPVETIQDDLWLESMHRQLRNLSRPSFFIGADDGPKHPPRILEPGRNLYAPKVVVLIEQRSFDCLPALLLESMRRAFRSYEYGQVYFETFDLSVLRHTDLVEDAKLVGARICLFYYALDAGAWVLNDCADGARLATIDFTSVHMDKRFDQKRWYSKPESLLRPVEKPKPKPVEPCYCGLCDRCLGL